jgi:hypothetical protein
MNLENLSKRQKDIISKLKVSFENDSQLSKWLSIPNKLFRNKPPIYFLLSDNFDYFERFLSNSSFE